MRAVLGAALLIVATLVQAGLKEGTEAYDSGNYAVALSELTPLAGQGNAEAQFKLGLMHDDGKGVPQDSVLALSWYTKAADQGHVQAQNNLAILYARGSGVPQDHKAAASWFQKAADQGNAGAQFNLGVMYANGRGVPRDLETAVSWFRKGADGGNEAAQLNLGVMYENAMGVPQDYASALTWYRKSAEKNLAGAQNALGAMYGKGLGVLQDFPAALSWYQKAAAQGHPVAQNNLGFMYLNGQGTPVDLAQAKKWFSLAAAQGNEDATANLALVEAKTGANVPPACEMQTADAHPDIKWVANARGSPGAFMSCLLSGEASAASIEVTEYLSSGLYKFISDCRDSDGVLLRIFEYKNKSRPYLLRVHKTVDAYTYIVIASYPKGRSDVFQHSLSQKSNSRVTVCPQSPAF